jgi:hypothetical protein
MEITADDILQRYRSMAPETGLAQARIHIVCDGPRLIYYTGEGYLRRSRLTARVAGAAAIVAGLALTTQSLWGLALAAAGIGLLALAPRLILPARLLELDADGGRLLITQPAAGAGVSLCLEQITALRGVYETQGWDPRSVIYARLTNGTEVSILVFPGTDEPLAEYACRSLGLLLDLNATYAGPFGDAKTCYERR